MSKIERLDEEGSGEDDGFQERVYDFYMTFMANAEKPWNYVFATKDELGNPNESVAHSAYTRFSSLAYLGYRFCMGSSWILGTTALLVAVPMVYGV